LGKVSKGRPDGGVIDRNAGSLHYDLTLTSSRSAGLGLAGAGAKPWAETDADAEDEDSEDNDVEGSPVALVPRSPLRLHVTRLPRGGGVRGEAERGRGSATAAPERAEACGGPGVEAGRAGAGHRSPGPRHVLLRGQRRRHQDDEVRPLLRYGRPGRPHRRPPRPRLAPHRGAASLPATAPRQPRQRQVQARALPGLPEDRQARQPHRP
jgi:hypothetical protein